MKRQEAFTLIELLVAITVFTILSAITYVALRDLININERTTAKAVEISDLQRVIMIMERDMLQIVQRPVLGELGKPLPAVMLQNDPPRVEFTRGGVANPTKAARSSLIRVAYEFQDGVLTRKIWRVLDRTAQSRPSSKEVLLKGLLAVRFSLWFKSWFQTWPPAATAISKNQHIDPQIQTPSAMAMEVESEELGNFRRLFVGAGG